MRNYADLETMACPAKYRGLHSFHRYYSGELRAPVLTVFVGGNHEATAYLSELPYGGWVAENIFYMGHANCVRFKGVRIAGLSGIYKPGDYERGRHEAPPYDQDTMRSAYHVRALDVFRLRQLAPREQDGWTKRLDVLFTWAILLVSIVVNPPYSHDWPTGITRFGDERWLLSVKPHFADDIARDTLGNPHGAQLLDALQPRHYFAAHLHVRFAARKRHAGAAKNETAFLALDKPHSWRQFLAVVDVPTSADPATLPDRLCYDPHWLAVLRSTDHLWHLQPTVGHGRQITNPRSVALQKHYIPGANAADAARFDFRPSDEELAAVGRLFDDDLRIPHNFRPTGPPHQAHETAQMFRKCQPLNYRNPQTTEWVCRSIVLIVHCH